MRTPFVLVYRDVYVNLHSYICALARVRVYFCVCREMSVCVSMYGCLCVCLCLHYVRVCMCV